MKRVTRLGGDVKKKSTAKALRVAAYCRVSTGSDAQLESLDAQKTHYENYINGREDWDFAGLYFDATDIIGLKQNPTNGRRFSPIFV